MTYRDNDVYFRVDGGYTLINASYTIESFSITPGQDPYRHISQGLVTSSYCSGKLLFRIGRKGSTEVAAWFNDRVPAAKTNFNHPAGYLNFAFLGTLRLTLTGGVFGGGSNTFTFSNIALAQGDSTFSSNWWFGGPDCQDIQNNQLTAPGVNAGGARVSFTFRLGTNGVNTILVTPGQLLDTANWMQGLNNALALNQIMMPGSHDAGMSELHHCAPAIGIGGYTQTQSGSIAQQLADGSRYFDIRVDYDYGELVTYHRAGPAGCNGQALLTVLDQARDFLLAHPTETAILKFSHIRSAWGHDPADIKQRINVLLDNYNNVMYTNNTPNINLATQVTLGTVRGRMILVFDYREYINPATGRFRYLDRTASQAGANLTVYDVYSNTADYDTMKQDQLAKWQTYGGVRDYLFLLSWTLTANNPLKDSNIQTLATLANGNLPGVLYDRIITAQGSKPNIVYLDYINPVVTQSVILYNFPGVWI
ncbi:MAG: hypothetical protein ABW019_08435 [Chitinophagaceae bacterium]